MASSLTPISQASSAASDMSLTPLAPQSSTIGASGLFSTPPARSNSPVPIAEEIIAPTGDVHDAEETFVPNQQTIDQAVTNFNSLLAPGLAAPAATMTVDDMMNTELSGYKGLGNKNVVNPALVAQSAGASSSAANPNPQPLMLNQPLVFRAGSTAETRPPTARAAPKRQTTGSSRGPPTPPRPSSTETSSTAVPPPPTVQQPSVPVNPYPADAILDPINVQPNENTEVVTNPSGEESTYGVMVNPPVAQRIETHSSTTQPQTAATATQSVPVMPDVTPPPLINQPASRPYSDLPDPRSILTDEGVAARLISGGLLEELRAIPSVQLRDLGPARIPEEYGGLELTPYMQVVIAFMHKYYSTLPDIGYCLNTFKLLHYYLRLTDIDGPGLPQPELRTPYQNVNNAGVDDLVTLAARILIDSSFVMEEELTSIVSPSVLYSRLDRVKVHLPFIFTIYNFVSHLVVGGSRCVEPIPSVVVIDSALSDYLDRICVGNQVLDSLTVDIPPRDASLPTAPYQAVIASVTRGGITPGPRTTTTTRAQQTRAAASSSSTTRFATSRTSTAQTRTVPPQSSVHQGMYSTAPARTTTRSLLAQGEPGRNQIIRDTTNFRQGVEADAVMEGRLQQVIDSVSTLSLEVASVKAENQNIISNMDTLTRSIENLDRTLAVLISQSSQQNLADRAVLNQTLLNASSGPAQQILGNATAPTPVQAGSIGNVIARLANFRGSPNEASSLVVDIQSILIAAGRNNSAASVTIASISNPDTRARIKSSLEKLPRTR